MAKNEFVCPRCGYKNQSHRSTCKNCGKALTEEAAVKMKVVIKNRKKPLKQWGDWIRAFVGFVFLITGTFFGVMAVSAAIELSMVSLLFLVFSAGLLYGGWALFLVPLYALFVFQRGHEMTKGRVIQSFDKEFTDTKDQSHTVHYLVISFIPEKSRDPRSRLLKCEILSGTKIWSSENIQVYYALENPDVILLEGEVKDISNFVE
jgi:hypothetical protein